MGTGEAFLRKGIGMDGTWRQRDPLGTETGECLAPITAVDG
jgi:hypothetical protein